MKCFTASRTLTLDEFIKRNSHIQDITNFSFEKSIYVNGTTLMTITCKIHGDFLQTPNRFHRGYLCERCSREAASTAIRTQKQLEFIERALETHGERYDYHKVKYIGAHDNVTIVCKIHGDFEQTPTNHRKGSGCQKCAHATRIVSKSEDTIKSFLIKNKIEFIKEKTFQDLINPITGRKLQFDFYIKNKDIIIEFDGPHHFKPIKWWGHNPRQQQLALDTIQLKDKLKNEYCHNKNITLIRINYMQNLMNELNAILPSLR